MRRCVEKETNSEFAAKIIDLTPSEEEDNDEGECKDNESNNMLQATLKEIRILKTCANHPHISKAHYRQRF